MKTLGRDGVDGGLPCESGGRPVSYAGGTLGELGEFMQSSEDAA